MLVKVIIIFSRGTTSYIKRTQTIFNSALIGLIKGARGQRAWLSSSMTAATTRHKEGQSITDGGRLQLILSASCKLSLAIA